MKMKQLKLFVQSRILDWYASHKRKLPWRETDNPYAILVSEIMLQQTQVDRVIPKYTAFLQRFPTPQALAAAQTSDVITLWSGLGYNRRAIALQKAAQHICMKKTFPSTTEELQTLPGIGPYTARAVLSFAFHKDVPVVDTNIRRIFSRHFFAGKGTPATIDKKVTALLPLGRSTDWNNALMDFGSLLCTANNPQCHSCPLQKSCTAYKKGTQHTYLKIAPPQPTFIGSRRQHRGIILRILKEAQDNTASFVIIQKTLKKPSTYVESILNDLQKDQLIVRDQALVSLPSSRGTCLAPSKSSMFYRKRCVPVRDNPPRRAIT